MSRIFKASNVILDTEKINIVSEKVIKSSINNIDNSKSEEKNLKPKKAEDVVSVAKAKAANLILKAEEESKKISKRMLERTNNACAGILKASKEKGYEEGFLLGVSEAKRIKEDANKVYEEAILTRENLFRNAEKDMIDLIINISEKIINNTAFLKPDLILNLVRQGVNMATLTGDVNIRVSSDDYDLIVKNKEDILKQVDNSSNIEIIRDLSLNKNDCVIETPFGNIDSSLEEQFTLLKEDLYYLLENRR